MGPVLTPYYYNRVGRRMMGLRLLGSDHTAYEVASMTKPLLCGLALLTSCVGCTPADGRETPHTIRVAVPSSGSRTGIASFEQVVESLSRGRVDVQVDFDTETCGGVGGCVDALHAGRVDAYPARVDELASVFPELQVLDIPYLFESDRVVAQVFVGAFYSRMQQAIADRTSLQLMTVSHGDGWRGIANDIREVRHPDDIDGLTFGTYDVPIQLELTRALGAETRLLPRTTPDTGLGDGMEGRTVGILALDAGRTPAFEHLTLDRHSYGVSLWLMNDAAYETLPAELQQIVRVGFDELRRLSFAFPNAEEAAALAAFETAGGDLYLPTPGERRAFVRAAGRVSTWFMDTYGPEWLVWLEEAIADAEREVRRSGSP